MFLLKNFLLYEEKDKQDTNIPDCDKATTDSNQKTNNNNPSSYNTKGQHERVHNRNVGIVVSNASAKWLSSQSKYSLRNVSLTVRPGRLVAIIGPVGAGKVRTI